MTLSKTLTQSSTTTITNKFHVVMKWKTIVLEVLRLIAAIIAGIGGGAAMG